MSNSSSAASLRERDTSARPSNGKKSLLENKRFSELVGFLLAIAALLLVLSLASYLAQDTSLNTSTASGAATHNWVGPAGAYVADLLFQGLGWVAYLLPLTFFVLGIRLLLFQQIQAPRSKGVGLLLLAGSLAAMFELFPYTPSIGGAIHGSGVAGYLLGAGLVHIFNLAGAWIVAGTVFLASLFLVTRFSFSAAFDFLRRRFAFLQRLVERWTAWLAARRRNRLIRRAEKQKVREQAAGPVVVQQHSNAAAATAPEPAPPAQPAPGPSLRSPSTLSSLLKSKIPSPPVLRGQGLDDDQPAQHAAKAPKISGRGSRHFKLPSPTLLRPSEDQQAVNEEELKQRAVNLTEKFAEFGVTGAVTQIHPGPVVTTYEFKPEAGIKYSRITSLEDDICLAMKAESILIERVPGKSTVGIEVPNHNREIIHLREIVESSEFATSPSRLTLCLGKDLTGKTKIGDLAQMPHLLIAGSTGAGKSVAINSMILSILYKSTPDEVKLIMIDPKRLELGLYDGIPHLFTPIVTEPKQAANVLRRATLEMETRLKKLAEHGVRNIEQYNKIFEPDSTMSLFDTNGEQEQPLPYLVIVIDELADLMMVEPQNVEESITRLAQMARAVGIHLILATQRPSVDVITGLIKANLPSRISFRVASKVDSRTILDSNGAEALLGKGDMLFMPPGTSRLLRLHGPLVTEKEIGKVVDWWKTQSEPHYNEEFLRPFRERDHDSLDDEGEEDAAELDEVYEEAVRLVVESGKASTSLLQRRLRVGYGRAARLIDLMERDGIVGAPDGSKPREVLKRPDWLEEFDRSMR
jgi:DNA segregation ATPase FtsK/SpoIIIE, S-DNA-T family